MTRRRRVKEWIIQILGEEGDMTTDEIYCIINKISCYGVTKNQLGNVLARSPEIEKKGFVNESMNGFRHRVKIWGLKNESTL